MSDTSFYTDGETYTDALVTSGDRPGSTTPSQAPSSMYPDGSVYDNLTLDLTSNAGIALPLMDASAAAAGIATKWAREDHVHPTDATRAPLVSPNFTGTVGLQSFASEQVGDYGSDVTDFAYNTIDIGSDGRVVTGNNLSTVGLLINLAVDQASGRGQKYAFRALTSSFGTGSVDGDLVGISGWALSGTNQGGTDTGAGAKGTLYGFEASGHAFPGATNYLVVSGGEANAWINTGASASHRWGWSISGIGEVRGSVSDAGLNIGAGALSWNTGVQFASYNGFAPVTTTGSVLGSDDSAYTVANWAHFPAITVTGNILDFQNFKVGGDGTAHAHGVNIGTGFLTSSEEATPAQALIDFDTSLIQSVGTGGPWHYSGLVYGASTNSVAVATAKTRGATASDHGAVVNGDGLYAHVAYASDGSNWMAPATWTFEVDGPVSANNVPTSWNVYTGSGYYTYSKRLSVGSDGNVSVLGSTASTSSTTGAFTVAGGAGIAGALNVGGAASAATAVVDTNTTQLATTAYFFGQAGASNPLAAGTAAPGTSSRWSRQDHVHPTDTTRAPLASPAFTGTPTAPTAAANTNTTQIATTAYADAIAALKANLASPTFTGTVGAAAIAATGAVKSSGGAIGYATGAGGTVTQATSKATGVTLSKFSGAITLNAAALASGAIVSFVMTNTNIAAGDVLVLNHISGGTIGPYLLNAQCAAGSATINVRNTSAASLSEAIVIQFALVKAVNA